MKLELHSASNFLVHLVRLSSRSSINDAQLEKFRLSLVEVLRRRYRDHWFPERPFKGSGYRCIRINGRMDPVIAQAAEVASLDSTQIHATFPSELTMWIDPLEVSYRIGENGSICVLYEFKEDSLNEPWRPNKTLSNENTKNNQQQQNQNSVSNSTSVTTNNTTNQALDNNCKETLRKMDYLLDPRKSVSIEQLAAYVSSS
jgi:protein Tob/BTG